MSEPSLNNDQLLRALLRLDGAERLRLADLEGPPLGACEQRLFTLLEQEGVQPMFAAHLRITWERRFAEAGAEGVACAELREGLQALRLLAASGGAAVEFQDRATLRLIESVGSLAMVNAFGDDVVERKALETGPLFTAWPAEILQQRRWNTIESVFPGLPDLPMSEAWVHLRLRKLRSRNLGLQSGRFGGRSDFMEAEAVPLYLEEELEDNLVGEPLLDVLHEIRNLTCVLGQPGAGKSTLIKWLARHLVTATSEVFTLPLFVNLREYALQQERSPGLTLFEFFLRQRGTVRDADQVERWMGLRQRLAARGTTEARDFCFWLLDGWDEVPRGRRDAVLREIQAIAEEPGIITSRHSASPLALPCSSFWEISVLPRHAQRALVTHWLRGMGSRVAAETVMERIRRLRGCDRLARNPMLLTLLCGLLSERGVARGTLRSRSDVYRETIRRIAEHHTRRHPSHPFDEDRLAQVRTLAARLFADEEAPIYGFTERDAQELCADASLFPCVLEPSRLVCCPSPESSLFQFHHATFQEYLTAEWLGELPDERGRLTGNKLVMDAGWSEVARFAATLPEIQGQLWNSVRALLQQPDRYGVMLARTAGLLSSAGARDGGRRLVGCDIREDLWALLLRHRDHHPWLLTDALLELDRQWLLRRMNAEMERHPDESEHMVLPFAKHLLLPGLETLGEDAEDPLLDRFNEALERLDFPAFQAAFECLPVDESGWEMREQAVKQMGAFGAAAVPFLTRLLTSDASDEVMRGMAAGELAQCEAPEAGRVLMRLLAGCEPEDDLVWHVLGALNGARLSPHETGLVSRLLVESGSAEIREEAAAVLGKSRVAGAAEFLLQAAVAEQEEAVRGRIWTSLLELADPAVLNDMWEHAHTLLETSADVREALPLMLAAGVTAAHAPLDAASHSILEGLTFLAGEWLESDNQAVVAAAANMAVLLGDELLEPMMRIVSEPTRAPRVRIECARSLGELGVQEAVPVLRALFDQPDCDCDEEVDSLHDVAAQALGKIAPEALLDLASPPADKARAHLAFSAAMLFFDTSLDQPAPKRSRRHPAAAIAPGPSVVIYGNVERSVFVQGDNRGMVSVGDHSTLTQQYGHAPSSSTPC